MLGKPSDAVPADYRSDCGNRGARAVIYAVTVAAVGIDLTQPLSETTDRRRNAKAKLKRIF